MSDYIIVQAGGKGTRMEHLTANKPKALVPVNNLPMLFHLFRKYPDKKFVIIGDYKYDVLHKYLQCFAETEYLMVNADGKKGTCAGLKKALALLPEKKSFMLIWSDLILSDSFEMPEENENFVGLSGDFRCRWSYENGEFKEEPSVKRGVAGLFVFKGKEEIQDVPEEGEFVRWLQQKEQKLKEIVLEKTKEYGILDEYKKLPESKCRPFNKMTVEGERIVKEGIDDQGRKLAVKEQEWYQFVEKLGYKRIPRIYSYQPFTMEKIQGRNIYEYKDRTFQEKKKIVKSIVDALKELHSLGSCEADMFSMHENYVDKTFERIDKVRNLIPFANEREIMINGRKCRNVFYYRDELEDRLNRLKAKNFCILHGDCTFSNMMLRNDTEAVLIDPRGYFGKTRMYGDVAYDWAKLYYSIAGNYDQFNVKNFSLDIMDEEICLKIESNGFEDVEDYFFELTEEEADRESIQLIHAVIWLSLTTYAWEDYDSICGAFYNGLYYLEGVL